MSPKALLQPLLRNKKHTASWTLRAQSGLPAAPLGFWMDIQIFTLNFRVYFTIASLDSTYCPILYRIFYGIRLQKFSRKKQSSHEVYTPGKSVHKIWPASQARSYRPAHVVFERFLGSRWNLRHKLRAPRCCMDPIGPKSRFSSNSVYIQIPLHGNLGTLVFYW